MSRGIPIIQIRGSSAVIYDEPFQSSCYSKKNFNVANMAKNRQGAYCGRMTQGARKRMTRAISLMVQSLKPKTVWNPEGFYQYHKLSFITLTVSNSHNLTAKTAYHLLFKHFLQWLRRTQGVSTYIWKAELQERGQIHYHITCPNFIYWKEIRGKWNELQRKAGLLTDYFQEHKHYDPNSTDIHAVEDQKKMDWYMVKELAKTIDIKRLEMKRVVESLVQAGEIPAEKMQDFIDEYTGQEINTEGKLWDCSENLSAIKLFNMALSTRHEHKINAWKLQKKIREVKGDFWSIIYFDGCAPPDLFNEKEMDLFTAHVDQVHTYQANRNRKAVDPAGNIVDVVVPGLTSWQPVQLPLDWSNESTDTELLLF